MSFVKSFQGYKNFLKLKNKNRKSVYIYSRSSSYRNHFEDIIKNLSNLNKYEVRYFTSNLLDNKSFTPDVKPIYIGSGVIRMIFFTF